MWVLSVVGLLPKPCPAKVRQGAGMPRDPEPSSMLIAAPDQWTLRTRGTKCVIYDPNGAHGQHRQTRVPLGHGGRRYHLIGRKNKHMSMMCFTRLASPDVSTRSQAASFPPYHIIVHYVVDSVPEPEPALALD